MTFKNETPNRPRMLLAGLLALPLLTALSGPPLAYRDRGDRHEGVKSKPVSGYDVELLGARVEMELPSELPDDFTVQFFLERQEKVYLTVRERDPIEFYWLDKVARTDWRSKATNSFTWPSQDVLGPLELSPERLLVLARLGREGPNPYERVAPVIFPGTSNPTRIAGYRFTFKSNGSARTHHRVFAPDSTEIQVPGSERQRRPDTPFDVRWRVGNWPEGIYRLRLEGYFLSDNARILQEVEFFHAPTWPR